MKTTSRITGSGYLDEALYGVYNKWGTSENKASEVLHSSQQIPLISSSTLTDKFPGDIFHGDFGCYSDYTSEASRLSCSERSHFDLGSDRSQRVYPMGFLSSVGPSHNQISQPTLCTVPKYLSFSQGSNSAPNTLHDNLYLEQKPEAQLWQPLPFLSGVPDKPYKPETQSHAFDHSSFYCGSRGQTASRQCQLPSEQAQGGTPNQPAGVQDSRDVSHLSLQHKILQCYINYGSSLASSYEGRDMFVSYMHSEVCSGSICNCERYFAVASHFDSCNDSDCAICGPARAFSVPPCKRAFDCDKFAEVSYGSSDAMLPSLKLRRIENQGSFGRGTTCALYSLSDHRYVSEGVSELHQMPTSSLSFGSEVTELNSPAYDITSTNKMEVFDAYIGEELRLGKPSKELSFACKPEPVDLRTIIQRSVAIAADDRGMSFGSVHLPPHDLVFDYEDQQMQLGTEFCEAESATKKSTLVASDSDYDLENKSPEWSLHQRINEVEASRIDHQLKTCNERPLDEAYAPCGTSQDMFSSMHRSFSCEGLQNQQQMPQTLYSDSESTVMSTETNRLIDKANGNEKERDVTATNEVFNLERPVHLSDGLSVTCKPEKADAASIRERVDDVTAYCLRLGSKSGPVSPKELVCDHEEEKMLFQTKLNKAMPGAKTESITPETSFMSERKLQKLEGVSLTEFFTAEQLKEHTLSLQQLVAEDVQKGGAENASTRTSENFCQLCGMERLAFPPPPMYCSSCAKPIKWMSSYYSTLPGEGTRHCICTLCYKGHGGNININGTVIAKVELNKRKNDEGDEEAWVQCDSCESWQHQICALFNDRKNMEGKAAYICPICQLKELETGKRKPLSATIAFGAKHLPRSRLSDHIEHRIFSSLKKEREKRAKTVNLNIDEVPGAEDLVVRVVSSVKKKLKVGDRLLSIIHDDRYPSEFPYKSKVILLFQKIEGADVCLFAMQVQEFGSECRRPNQRCVYISYLDSVRYFRPEIKCANGEALRTFAYHELLIGYLDYCKKRGFATCYLWACPPSKGEDYIFYCHPETQRTPKPNKLRQWYEVMLRKAAAEEIVLDINNLYDYLFVPSEECNAQVTAARLPHFDECYWSSAAEEMIRKIEEGGEDQLKMAKKRLSRRTIRGMGQNDQSDDATKDILLMQKLGKAILPKKEDFFVIHLQFVCTKCHEVMPCGSRCLCSQCKKSKKCERCHIAEIEHYFENSQQNQSSSEDVAVNMFPDTEDHDINLGNGLFESRHTFLSFCQGNNYLFDTLRRAKHSSMMILYHFHSTFFTRQLSLENHAMELKESKQRNVLLARQLLNLLSHSSQCRPTASQRCSYPKCSEIKRLFAHASKCNLRVSGNCLPCRKIWLILFLHSRNCKDLDCGVPRCMDLKKDENGVGKNLTAEELVLQISCTQFIIPHF